MSRTSSACGRWSSFSRRPAYLKRCSRDSVRSSASGGLASPSSQARCCSGSRNWRRPLAPPRLDNLVIVLRRRPESRPLRQAAVPLPWRPVCAGERNPTKLTKLTSPYARGRGPRLFAVLADGASILLVAALEAGGFEVRLQDPAHS